MRIVFRTDASLQIGTGHVMRCLTLADAFFERGAQITFICRPHIGHLIDLIKHRGHSVITLPPVEDVFTSPLDLSHAKWLGVDWVSDAKQTQQALGNQHVDWLVVDHYALDGRWEQALRPFTRHILAIDDLADRPHDCDLLLDQNLGRQADDYRGLLSGETKTLIGPKYALLRPEFAQWREYSLQRRESTQLKNLLITMGGVDQSNITCRVLEVLTKCQLPNDLCVTVVMGLNAPWLAQVKAQSVFMTNSTQVLTSVNNMAQLMANSSLCIGAAGSTSWERCCLGLPTIQFVLAANQKEINEALELAGAIMTIQLEKLEVELPNLTAKVATPDVLNGLSRTAVDICDGLGVIKTAQSMEKFTNENYSALQ